MAIRAQPIAMGLKQITGLADAVDDNDAVNKAQLDAAVAAVDLSLYAPKASPTFTGVPAAPTATAATNTTQLATTAFVTTADNLKANLASPTFTGTPAAPTAAVATNTTQLATTAFVLANRNEWTRVMKTSDQTTVTSSFADDNELFFTIASTSVTYEFRFVLFITNSYGWQVAVNGPTLTTLRVACTNSTPSVVAYNTSITGNPSSGNALAIINGTIKTSATGTFKLRIAQWTTNAAATTFQTNSYLEYRILA